jgi:hypothetical protein
MKFILRIPGWVLFLVLFLIPIILVFSLPKETLFDKSLKGTIITSSIFFFFVGSYLGWIFIAGFNLYKKLPDALRATSRKSFAFFKFFNFLLFFHVCLLLFVIFQVSLNFSEAPWVAFILFFTHLISFYGIFYCAKFISRTLKSVEENRPLRKGEGTGDAILFLFVPIGIWYFQDRLNSVFSK